MRTTVIFDDVDASVTQTSASIEIDCGQDMRYLIQLVKTGTDGDPKIFLEESLDEVVWTCIPNYLETDQSFAFDDDEIALRDSYFMGKYIRVRIEPNGNTSGTIDGKLGIKTKTG